MTTVTSRAELLMNGAIVPGFSVVNSATKDTELYDFAIGELIKSEAIYADNGNLRKRILMCIPRKAIDVLQENRRVPFHRCSYCCAHSDVCARIACNANTRKDNTDIIVVVLKNPILLRLFTPPN